MSKATRAAIIAILLLVILTIANGSEILTQADEGTGNGLDADTLDGVEAAAFATLAGTNAFTGTNTIDGFDIGYLEIPQNAKATSYTLVAADSGKHIYKASGGAGETITIPANASVAFDVGTAVTIVNDGGGTLTLAITTDTLEQAGTGDGGPCTLADGAVVTVLKVASTKWFVSGTGISACT